MALPHTFQSVIRATRHLPVAVRWAGTALLVAASFGLAVVLERDAAAPSPFLFFLPAVMFAAIVFDRGSGLLAAVLGSVAAMALLPFPPDRAELVHVALFVLVASLLAIMLEALHAALERALCSDAACQHADRRRALLLREFRHRSRNDLQSLAALLQLRARGTASAAAADSLREAATHALTLARVQHWLAPRSTQPDDPATVDTRCFLEGLTGDLRLGPAGRLRPLAVSVAAEPHALDTERALQLGLVLNELMVNACAYGFPDDRAGHIEVGFRRDDWEFVLTVADDGIGIEESDALPVTGTMDNLGTRLLAGLAAQLRGGLRRRACGPAGGTCAELRFPVAAAA